MNIAFIHCWIKIGGALDVLKQLIQNEKNNTDGQKSQIYVFCLFSDRKFLEIDNVKIKIITALPILLNNFFINTGPRIPFFGFLFDYRNLLPFYPLLIKLLGWKLSKFKYDKIIISSFAVSKNIKFDYNKKSLLYLHSPMQYIWENYEEYVSNLHGIKRFFFMFFSKYLRKRDKKYTKFDIVYTNSIYTQKIAEKLYGYKNIKVKYPKIDKIWIKSDLFFEVKDYFVFVGRIANLIRNVDKVIELCNYFKVNLLVIGYGPDLDYCKKISGPTITFIPRVSDKFKLVNLIGQSRGLINISKESLGLSTIQALCLGVPIFGYNKGGTAELVGEESGILVPDKDLLTLKKYFQEFMNKKFDRKIIRDNIIKLINNTL